MPFEVSVLDNEGTVPSRPLDQFQAAPQRHGHVVARLEQKARAQIQPLLRSVDHDELPSALRRYGAARPRSCAGI
jgi:hypothetical protein